MTSEIAKKSKEIIKDFFKSIDRMLDWEKIVEEGRKEGKGFKVSKKEHFEGVLETIRIFIASDERCLMRYDEFQEVASADNQFNAMSLTKEVMEITESKLEKLQKIEKEVLRIISSCD